MYRGEKMKMPIPVYMGTIFAAMLLFGIVTLLPSHTKFKKKRKMKISKIIESVIVVFIGGAGLYLVTSAYIIKNDTAIIIFNKMFFVCLIAGLVIWLISGILKIKDWLFAKSKTLHKSILIGNIEVLYGISTPQIFDGTKYKVDFSTMVQDKDIPFITCELHTIKDNEYIGDLFFDSVNRPVDVTELCLLPITDIHLDR